MARNVAGYFFKRGNVVGQGVTPQSGYCSARCTLRERGIRANRGLTQQAPGLGVSTGDRIGGSGDYSACFKGSGRQYRTARDIIAAFRNGLEDRLANEPGRSQPATRLGDIACEAAKCQSIERVPGIETLSKTPPCDRRYCGFIRKLVVKEQEAIEKIEGGGNRQRVGYVPIAGGASPQHKTGADRIAGIALIQALLDDSCRNRAGGAGGRNDFTEVPRNASPMIAKRNRVSERGHSCEVPSTALRTVAFPNSEME